ncbi:Acetyltransferase (GNAT) domain-containing protein [Lachnospiraceae bacterium XBB1006]|nr:Acetyltransferase (GNAT) domain-containing protein [Lachnospiraceae bacterium XBB1006]
MTKKQQELLLRMFAEKFENTAEEERKEIYYEFAENFSEHIDGWWATLHSAFIRNGMDEEGLKQWRNLEAGRCSEVQKTAAEIYTICEMTIEDEKQINDILVQELGVVPRFSGMGERGTAKDFAETGFSFVAKKGKAIVGVIFAQKVIEYGQYYILVNDFAITDSEQGNGLGSLMINHLRKLALEDDVHIIRLGTTRTRKAYEIYHHWGFEDQDEETVYLKNFFF